MTAGQDLEAPLALTPRRAAQLLRPSLRAAADNRARPGHRLRHVGRALDRPIFVVGAPRSGTTLLGDILGAHPHTTYHFEPGLTKAASRYVHDERWSRRRARATYTLTYRLLVVAGCGGGRRFAEKTPQNCHVLPFLAAAFPSASFVHIVRDGHDAAGSLLAKPWYRADAAASGRREPGGYAHGPFARYWVEPARRAEFETTSDLHRCIWTWRAFTQAARDGLAALPGERGVTIRYEDLVADPASTVGTILGALDLPPDPGVDVALRAVTDASVGQARSRFAADDLDVIGREAGPLLRSLGYE